MEAKFLSEMERGAKAEKLLNDPFLVEALAAVKTAIHDSIDRCPIRDTEGLIALRLQLKALEHVKAYLETALRDGKLAAEQIRREQTQVTHLSDFKRPYWRAEA